MNIRLFSEIIECIEIDNIIYLILFIEIRKVILRLAFLFIYLLIKHLIEIDHLID